MKTSSHPSLLAAIACTLLLPTVPAQTPSGAPPVLAVPAVPATPPTAPVPPVPLVLPLLESTSQAGLPAGDEPRFDFQLPAGISAEEAIDRLSDTSRTPVNVVWTGESQRTKLPALRLHQVTVREFLAAVSAAGRAAWDRGGPGYVFGPVDGAPNVFTFSVLVPTHGPARHVVQNLFGEGPSDGEGGGDAGLTSAQAKTSRFFDLSALLDDDLSIDDITTAIRTAWSAAGDGEDPPSEALRYHQETKLLIATARPDRLQAVDEIVMLLKARHQPSQDQKDQQILQTQRELKEALSDRDRSVGRLNALREESETKIDLLREQSAKESEATLAKFRERIAELEIELAKVRNRP